MNGWIILIIAMIIGLSIEPLGLIFVERKTDILLIDIQPLVYHTGDTITRLYLLTDENDNVYISEYEIPLFDNIEITYKGFNIPKLGIIPRIKSYKHSNF